MIWVQFLVHDIKIDLVHWLIMEVFESQVQTISLEDCSITLNRQQMKQKFSYLMLWEVKSNVLPISSCNVNKNSVNFKEVEKSFSNEFLFENSKSLINWLFTDYV